MWIRGLKKKVRGYKYICTQVGGCWGRWGDLGRGCFSGGYPLLPQRRAPAHHWAAWERREEMDVLCCLPFWIAYFFSLFQPRGRYYLENTNSLLRFKNTTLNQAKAWMEKSHSPGSRERVRTRGTPDSHGLPSIWQERAVTPSQPRTHTSPRSPYVLENSQTCGGWQRAQVTPLLRGFTSLSCSFQPWKPKLTGFAVRI